MQPAKYDTPYLCIINELTLFGKLSSSLSNIRIDLFCGSVISCIKDSYSFPAKTSRACTPDKSLLTHVLNALLASSIDVGLIIERETSFVSFTSMIPARISSLYPLSPAPLKPNTTVISGRGSSKCDFSEHAQHIPKSIIDNITNLILTFDFHFLYYSFGNHVQLVRFLLEKLSV